MSDQRRRPSILVLVPPPVWALIFMLIGWGAGAVLAAPTVLRAPLAGWPLLAAGAIIAASGRLAFARAGTEVMPASKKNTVLVTTGPFRWTRNPMYLGIITLLMGVALLVGTITVMIAVLVFFLFVNVVSIPFEEEKMERQFGDDYRAYKARVRRWL